MLSTPALKLAVETYHPRLQARAPSFQRWRNFPSEEIVQPLTALLARTEVVIDLLDTGNMADLPGQLASMGRSAERLAALAEAGGRSALGAAG